MVLSGLLACLTKGWAGGSKPSVDVPGLDFPSLPGSAQLRILQLVCDSCGPDAPGTCWVSPVCKQWRDRALRLKGLRVVYRADMLLVFPVEPVSPNHPAYQSYQLYVQQVQEQQQLQQRTASFCAWLRRHAHQVVALGVTGCGAGQAMAALAEVACSSSSGSSGTAAGYGGGAGAAGGPAAPGTAGSGHSLPLQRLVVTGTSLWTYKPTLQQLLGALPHLHHLHLPSLDSLSDYGIENAGAAAVAALAPLQHTTSLTSLVLEGPAGAAAQQQVQEILPSSLQRLGWSLQPAGTDEALPSFNCLTGLTALRLTKKAGAVNSHVGEDCFTSLRNLRQLVLEGIPISDAGLLACKEQLVTFAPGSWTQVLRQLTHLQMLGVGTTDPQITQQLLQQAPPVQALHVQLHYRPQEWGSPWVLQHYKWLAGLKRLGLTVEGLQAAPAELCSLTQLQRLTLTLDKLDKATAASWAQALGRLGNLEVLSVPAVLTACGGPWLTGLTRLAFFEVKPSLGGCVHETLPKWVHVNAAAAHIGRFVMQASADPSPTAASCSASTTTTSSSSSSSSSSGSFGSSASGHWHSGQTRMVCFAGFSTFSGISSSSVWSSVELYPAVVAAVPVLPPGVHLFKGSWRQLQQCGMDLWPAPVAARLRQVHLGCYY